MYSMDKIYIPHMTNISLPISQIPNKIDDKFLAGELVDNPIDSKRLKD